MDAGIGTIATEARSGIREADASEPRTWGNGGNEKLLSWEFNSIHDPFEYKAEDRGMLVDRGGGECTSKACSRLVQIQRATPVARALVVWESCETGSTADENGSGGHLMKSIRSPPTGAMNYGWLAQPGIFPFDEATGAVPPRG